MPGERDPRRLVAGMAPALRRGEWVFATLPGAPPAGIEPVVTVREDEGLTVVVARAEADAAGLPYGLVTAWITLTVHSALDAVGLTAAFATALAERGIACNVVAGALHDHLFVPADRAAEALAALEALADSA